MRIYSVTMTALPPGQSLAGPGGDPLLLRPSDRTFRPDNSRWERRQLWKSQLLTFQLEPEEPLPAELAALAGFGQQRPAGRVSMEFTL